MRPLHQGLYRKNFAIPIMQMQLLSAQIPSKDGQQGYDLRLCHRGLLNPIGWKCFTSLSVRETHPCMPSSPPRKLTVDPAPHHDHLLQALFCAPGSHQRRGRQPHGRWSPWRSTRSWTGSRAAPPSVSGPPRASTRLRPPEHGPVRGRWGGIGPRLRPLGRRPARPGTGRTTRVAGHDRRGTRTFKTTGLPGWIAFNGAAQLAQPRRTTSQEGCGMPWSW